MDIEKIISNLSLKEKIAQISQILYLNNHEEVVERLKKEPIGSLIMATDALSGNKELDAVSEEKMNELQEISMKYHGIPLLFGTDIIHGYDITYPVPLAMTAAFDPDAVKEAFKNIAEEGRKGGINWTFTPMLDVSRDPRWGRVIEGPGEDPYLGEKLAESVVKGVQGDGDKVYMAACAKHYVGYGRSEGGRDYHSTDISDFQLRNYYLRAFKSAVKSGCSTVMNSFNEISGMPTAASRYLLTDVLRGEFGFEGFVISDWGAIVQLIRQGIARDKKDCAELSINAGLDMDMCDNCFYDNLKELVSEGKVSMETIDEAVRRVLRVKNSMGLFEEPYIPTKSMDLESHKKLARELAADSIVLLKNENNALPLKPEDNIAVAGEFLEDKRNILGSWASLFELRNSVTILDGLKAVSDNIQVHEFGCEDTRLMFKDAVVLVLGEHYSITGESSNLSSIELTEKQKEMIKIAKRMNKRVIGVLMFSRPRAMEDIIDKFDAVVYAWHGGSEMGNAVADVLFGKVSPSGKLPMTLPRVTGQVPIYYNAPPSGRDCNGYYGDKNYILNYFDCSGRPLYPFGYGLSYSEFEIKDIKVKEDEISLDDLRAGKKFKISAKVKNTGKTDSKFVTMCFIRDDLASMTRPLKELKAFDKSMYKSGEKKEVIFELGFDDLGFYRADSKYAVEPGTFKIYVGQDSYAEDYVQITVK